MSSSTIILALDQLPLEILHCIFYHLDIPDIGRLRRVNRYLNEASHCRSVWSDVYRRAEFVRPPGPFLSQSAHDLEKVLVSSFRVDRNLRRRFCGGPAQAERPAPRPRKVRYTGMELGASLALGRFLLIAFKDHIRCYNLSPRNSHASVVYRTMGGILREYDCVSAINSQGRRFACVVLNEEMQTTRRISIHLVNVRKKYKATLRLIHESEHNEFNIDSVHLGPRAIVIQGQSGHDIIAMDVHTRTHFLIPSFSNAMSEIAGITEDSPIDGATMPTTISTSTHILLASSYSFQATGGWRTFFQVFTLPLPETYHRSTPSPIPLSPSHGGTVPGIQVEGTVLLHDSIPDPNTHDTLIAIAVHVSEASSLRGSVLKHGTLRLSNRPTSYDGEIGTITFQLLGSLSQLSQVPFLYPTFNGVGRVFYTVESGSRGTISALEYDLRGNGGGGKQDAKIVEYPSVLRFPAPPRFLDYDPYSCRICLQLAMNYDVIEVFDLAAY